MNTETKQPKVIRCAVYTRKSTEEGLEQEFNSLDAQREAAESYIQSQKHEGWRLLPERYDDGGFTGGNMDRPALAKLIKDIERGRVDCVVVYKVDRLSRSLLDFATLMNSFDKHNVTFVSVTQAFNTTTSMGRLTLNILLSFAQFEREIIGERIRDKIAAAKRKGKHTGGMPVLGYDIENSKLVVNPAEAKTVRDIFRRFLVLRSPLNLAKELNAQGVTTKEWTTQKGKVHKDGRWNKSNIYKLLNNRKYIGEVTHHGAVYPGEHDAIVDAKTWERVQEIFKENGRSRGNTARARTPAVLKGLLKCGHCGGSLGITYSRKNGKNYHYYHCIAATKNGFDSCPVRRVPAAGIESAVVQQIRGLLRAPETLALAHRALSEERTLNTDNGAAEATDLPGQKEFARALADVDAVWEHLFPVEQARICRLLVDRVTVNPDGIDMRLRTCGVNALFGELQNTEERKEAENV
jgi:DNA invertase Pin-like site-specific DNA recombinase